MMDLKANNKVCWILQFLLLNCICFSGFVYCGKIIPKQTHALLAIKSCLVDNSGRLSDWKYSDSTMPMSPCSWTGITCNNQSRVVDLDLSSKNLSGKISQAIELLGDLVSLDISQNQFDGPLTEVIFRLPKLRTLYINQNSFNGSFPEIVLGLQKLVEFKAYDNNFTGPLPWQFSLLSNLKLLNLARNYFNGSIPIQYGDFLSLEYLHLEGNEIRGSIPAELGKLQELRHLEIGYNRYTGGIPWQLGNLSKLDYLSIASANLSGSLPVELGKLQRLRRLSLNNNRLTGFIPWQLSNLTGRIPFGFGKLENLSYLDLSRNNFSGQLPSDLYNAPRLEYLNVSYNPLQGSLPTNIWATPILQIFSAAFANLSGKLPSFEHCNSVYKLELHGNRISGSIPETIAKCQKLMYIELSQNELTGVIPPTLASLPSLGVLDLSHNALSGIIPLEFQKCSPLESFDVSFNHLSGPVPSEGIFKNIDRNVFAGNPGLCGGVLVESPCMNSSNLYSTSFTYGTQRRTEESGVNLWGFVNRWWFAWLSVVAIIILIVWKFCFHGKHRGYAGGGEKQDEDHWKMTSFQNLRFTVEDVLERLESATMVGTGATGTVYRAEMPGDKVVAVKKLRRVENEERNRRGGALAEVEILGNVRHRNIVKILAFCSNNHDTLLLYDYMPNGNLENFLHGSREESMLPEWTTRHKIAVGVAQGLCYLHHDCRPVVVHRDVKPSNILLDADMNAKIADFGESKLIQTSLEPMTTIAGSYGYIAPECAYTLEVREKSDIYSFGVVLLELLTGRRPADPEFGEATHIVEWVKEKIRTKEGIAEIFDQRVVASCSSDQKDMMLVLHLALLCTRRSPNDRPSMRDVVRILPEAYPARKTMDPKTSSQGNTTPPLDSTLHE